MDIITHRGTGRGNGLAVDMTFGIERRKIRNYHKGKRRQKDCNKF